MLLIVLVSGVLAWEPSNASSRPEGVRPLMTMLDTCGFRRQDYRLEWDQVLQDEIVMVRLRNDRLSDRSLACMAHASFLIPATYEFRAPGAQRRFEAIKNALPETAALLKEYDEQARNWLDKRGLLAGALAILNEVGTLGDRAVRVEAYCGFRPGSVLQVKSERVYVLPRSGPRVTYDDLEMLLNVLAVAMPESAVALVGEEAPAGNSAAQ